MITFYHAPQSRSVIVHWMLEEVGEPYEFQLLNLKKNEQRQPPYLAINPMGKVPAITHDGVVITEAAAICCYLADTFPKAGLAVPIGDKRRGPYLKWLFFGPSCFEPAVVDRMFQRKAENPMALGWGDFDTMLGVITAAIAKGPYLLGGQFTAADVVIGSGLRWGTMIKHVPELPEIRRYIERLDARPALKRVFAKDAELVAAQAA